MTYFNETGQLPADAIEKEIFGEIEQVSPSQKAREARRKDFNPKKLNLVRKSEKKLHLLTCKNLKLHPKKYKNIRQSG